MARHTAQIGWVIASLASAVAWAQAPESPPAEAPPEAAAPAADGEAPPPKPKKKKTPPPEATAPEGEGEAPKPPKRKAPAADATAPEAGGEATPPPVAERPKRRRADAGTPPEGAQAVLPPAPSLHHGQDGGVELTGLISPHADADEARTAARTFFANLILGDARELVLASCSLPFYVEDRRFTSSEELLQEWLKNLRDKRTDLLTLYGIELLTPQEMEKKYGKPPARLSAFPWKQPRTYIAVANLSGHAAVAVVQEQTNRGWRVVAFHD